MEASARTRTGKSTSSSVKYKVFAPCFFDCNGVMHHEFLPQGCTINKEYYLEVIRRLCAAIHQKRTELWKNQSWILQHNKAPSYILMLVREFLAKNKTVIMPQPPYSSDLVPVDFFRFFPKAFCYD